MRVEYRRRAKGFICMFIAERDREIKRNVTLMFDDFISICNLLNELRVASGALIITPHRNITILMNSSAMI